MTLQYFFRDSVMAKCDVCGKSVQFGNNVSHSKRRTSKIWKPNVKKLRVLENNRKVRKYVCTRCIRTGCIVKAV
jgi:large subunit ribosomal protein L28